jgi:hypothetical protein
MRILFKAIIIGFCGPLLMNCGSHPAPQVQADFTKADSLTEYYLSLHDSIHQVWNIMINDDNQKIGAMHNLLHELSVSHPEEVNTLKALAERLDQLLRMRYTQKSMSNADVITEYDFASNALISELLTNAQQKKEFSYNRTLQKLVEDIQNADSRIIYHRFEYDSFVKAYNQFIEQNKEYLLETDETLTLEKKPTFRTVAEN